MFSILKQFLRTSLLFSLSILYKLNSIRPKLFFITSYLAFNDGFTWFKNQMVTKD